MCHRAVLVLACTRSRRDFSPQRIDPIAWSRGLYPLSKSLRSGTTPILFDCVTMKESRATVSTRWLAVTAFVLGVAATDQAWARAPSGFAPTEALALYANDGAGPQTDELELQRVANRDLFIKGLIDLAVWCTDNELYLERDNLYHRVIEMDPDNLDARKGLRYARNPDGSWKDPAPRVAKNRNERALAQLSARRGESMRPYCDALLEFLDRTHADAALRKTVIDEVLSIDPDNTRLHQLFKDVQVEGKWMTLETACGLKERAAIKALIKASQAAVAPAMPATNTLGLKGTDRKWKCALQTANVRVLGNVSEQECRQIAQMCEVAAAVVKGLLACPVESENQYTVYVFTSQEDKDAFVAKLTDITVEGRALMLSRANVGVEDTDDVLLSDTHSANRLDGAVRHVLARLLNRALGVSEKQGWLGDGLGSYLTHELCGTRSTWFILGALGGDLVPWTAKLLTANADWLDEALKTLQGETPVRLETVVTLNLRSMRIEDMLCGHALAAYVIEGHPSELSPLLKQIAAGEPSPAVLKAVLGSSMDELQTRLRRWMRERH